jgi:HEAT repeat protein
MNMRASECRALVLVILAFTASSASATILGRAIALEELAIRVDLVCKATVVADRVVTDEWFEPVGGYEARETELRVVSVIRGTAADVIKFRHYARSQDPRVNLRLSYQFVVGRSYLVFAARAEDGTYRQWSKAQTVKADQGVLLAANAKPHTGTTVRQAVWAELLQLRESPNDGDAIEAIRELDELSDGQFTRPKDFERSQALAAIRPLLASSRVPVATAAVTVFGAESPYFDDSDAPYWLAGMGKGTILGLAARVPSEHPAANVAVKELLHLATSGMTPQLRALAIRTLAPLPDISAAMISEWLRDPNVEVRQAAVLASAAHGDRTAIATAVSNSSPAVRHAAALAIGFMQDPGLVRMLDALLHDPESKVRAAAALSLLAFASGDAEQVMKANLAPEFRPLFINALARADPQPYLPLLAEVIEQQLQPENWWGGSIPAGDSWLILYGFVKSRPSAELASGELDRSLDALERMQWFSSAEPRALYALYLSRGLVARAQQFREATRRSVPDDIDYFFDMADKDPATYLL